MDKEKARKIVDTATEAADWTVGGALRLVARIIISVVMIFIITGLLFACIFAYYVKTELNSKLKITLEDASMDLSSTIWYTDSEGNDHELQMLSSNVKRIWVDYENLPKDKMMEHALVAIEDKRFYEHRGVDWYRTAGAVVQMFFSMANDFGGSTITQQLIKNNTENNADLVSRKLLEIFQALELEKTYEKNEIIEWYLNTVYFGEGCYGVYTAAQTYFGKDVWDLSLAECASIVGITNNPSKYDPFIANTITDKALGLTLTCREWNKYRQELVLQQMYEQGYITYTEYRSAVNEELNFVRPVNEVYTQDIESFYVEMVKRDVLADLKREFGYSDDLATRRLYRGGLQIYCCLDPRIQAIVDNFYENTDNLPKAYYASDQQLQSGMMIVDPYTGNIKAVAGAVGKKEVNAAWNYATDSKRQVGSSIKPLSAYGPAMEYGLITQNTLVNDSPNIRLSGTNWSTVNADRSYRGIVTIRTALQLSLNTVAAQLVDKLTPAESYSFMTQRLGFTSLVDSDADYAPMALGALTYGATVREMTQAYTSFVNEGVMTYARSYTKILDSDGNPVINNEPKKITAFSPNTAANMCDMLANAATYGTGAGAGFAGMAFAGKTGTTAEDNDRYFVGFTPYYVAAVWTGYDTPETMYFHGNPAVTIWHTIMEQV
ncbi:MAG: transglycosylase domain-containing protein, partial [Oscillospiraceae bacterium]|nr:transglycosylase domain-containing protein [Oscillospiraceae bacterium]